MVSNSCLILLKVVAGSITGAMPRDGPRATPNNLTFGPPRVANADSLGSGPRFLALGARGSANVRFFGMRGYGEERRNATANRGLLAM